MEATGIITIEYQGQRLTANHHEWLAIQNHFEELGRRRGERTASMLRVLFSPEFIPLHLDAYLA